jgi:putative ABC transport system permease protein
MLYNYLITAWRALLKHKLHAILNLLGMAIGIAASLLMWLYAQDELSFDNYHPQVENSYRLTTDWAAGPARLQSMVEQLGDAKVAAVTQISSDMSRTTPILLNNETIKFTGLHSTDEAFLDIFHLDFLDIDKKAAKIALTQPNQILLSRSAAIRLFGTVQVSGKTITLDYKQGTDLNVAGVFADLPANTHLQISALYSLATYDLMMPRVRESNSFSFYTYVKLVQGVSAQGVQQTLLEQVQKRMGHHFTPRLAPRLQPLVDIHLHSDLLLEMRPNGNADIVNLCLMLAAFVLLVACFNFINMATARSSLRAKEVGVRKALGASRSQLIVQFLIETLALTSVAAILATALIELSLPGFNHFVGKSLSLDYLGSHWRDLSILVVIVSLLAGAYPAFFISSYRVIQVLSGNHQVGGSSVLFRKALVLLQAGLATLLLVMTGLVYQQLQFSQSLPQGYNKDQVLILPELSVAKLWPKYEVFKQRVLANDNVVSVTNAGGYPTDPIILASDVRPEGKADHVIKNVPSLGVDYHYLATLEIELLAGRAFSPDFPADRHQRGDENNPERVGVLINQAALRAAGWQNPETAIGKRWTFLGNSEGTIVGVFKDFHIGSARQAISPMFLALGTPWAGANAIALKIKPHNMAQTKQFIEKTYRSVYDTNDNQAHFLDQDFAALFEQERKQISLLFAFTGLTILITCIGLFGLAAFTAERRSKEIAVRKVLGASRTQLVTMLTLEFTSLVILANILAWPIAYFAGSAWLENYAYRIDISWTLFVGASLVTLAITWLTVAGLSFKAASSRPVLSLRYE